MDIHGHLRTWARGSYALSASVELLIRSFDGRFAQPGQPWIVQERSGAVWLDDQFLASSLGQLSGGERRVMTIVVALADPARSRGIDLVDTMSGVDRGHADLILAALAHAAGSHEHAVLTQDARTGAHIVAKADSLHPWPHSERRVPANRISDTAPVAVSDAAMHQEPISL